MLIKMLLETREKLKKTFKSAFFPEMYVMLTESKVGNYGLVFPSRTVCLLPALFGIH